MRDAPKGVAEFEFEDVPLGTYRLTLHSYDGLRYSDRIRFVRPPATDIEFVAIGEIEPLQFRALDGERELEADPWVLLSGRWCRLFASCELGDVERWILVAENHRPASGATVCNRLRPESIASEAGRSEEAIGSSGLIQRSISMSK